MDISNIKKQHLLSILALNEESVAVLSPLDLLKLKRLINHASLAKVLIVENQVAAFLLAFRANADYDSINYQWFNARYAGFLYIDRIVIAKNFRGQGMGASFYNFVLDYAQTHSIQSIVAEIDIQPPNEASLNFHKRFGFVEVEQLIHRPQKIVSLQQRKLIS